MNTWPEKIYIGRDKVDAFIREDIHLALLLRVAELENLINEVLSATVDASAYPDGPCLEKSLRNDLKKALEIKE